MVMCKSHISDVYAYTNIDIETNYGERGGWRVGVGGGDMQTHTDGQTERKE